MRNQSIKDVELKVAGAVPIPAKVKLYLNNMVGCFFFQLQTIMACFFQGATKAELIEAVSKSLKWLVSIDSKNTHMKQISGFIWQKGYEEGKIEGQYVSEIHI